MVPRHHTYSCVCDFGICSAIPALLGPSHANIMRRLKLELLAMAALVHLMW